MISPFTWFIFSIQVFGLCSITLLSVAAIDLSPCAKWSREGKTVIGTNNSGNGSDQLNLPRGMFLHSESNTLYIADTGNRRIQKVSLSQSSNVANTVASNIDSISAVHVSDNASTLYLALRYENRVEKWTSQGLRVERIGSQCKQCAGVWLDKDKNIYMTESGRHAVFRWSQESGTSELIAGQIDELGKTSKHLYFPQGIYVSRSNNLVYVSDSLNHRIQKWNRTSKTGVTVAGSKDGFSGYDSSTLSSPSYIWLDETNNILYIVDSENNRIQRWLTDQSSGTTIAGGEGRGNANYQLSLPNSLSFDNSGNLYVCDGDNHRIQMFELIDNQPCQKVTTIKPTSSSIRIIANSAMTFVFISWTRLIELQSN